MSTPTQPLVFFLEQDYFQSDCQLIHQRHSVFLLATVCVYTYKEIDSGIQRLSVYLHAADIGKKGRPIVKITRNKELDRETSSGYIVCSI